MKICPRCGTTTTDDAQAYCLMDGAPLVDQLASEPTIVMSPTQAAVTTQQPRKKRTGLWITLGLLTLLVVVGLIGVLIYAAYRMGSESTSVKINTNSNTAPPPKPSATARSTSQTTPSTAATQEPTPESSPGDLAGADEPTPISWSENPGFVKTETGLRYRFECPPDGTAGAVWGSDVYTADSSVCTAAVHAGKITLEKGGIVTIEFTPGRSTYGATTRNGITTNNFGQYDHSFVFK
ncbi:MAG: LCCL domain-containing protein [Pyrinomonadaceae bacterium]